MKRFALLLLLPLIFAFGAPVAYAQTAGGSYEEALKHVRAGRWVQSLAEFKPLAEEGHAPSQFSIGLIYHLGRGVPVDLTVAYEWYKKAAVQHHPLALNNIAMMYLNGEYVARNRDVAFQLLQMSSAENHAQANDSLGQCYENGWGVAQDAAKAVEYYEKAGDVGFIKGYFNAGQLLEKDMPGAPKDIDRAVEFYVKAAESGVSDARRRLIRLKRLPEHLKKQPDLKK